MKITKIRFSYLKDGFHKIPRNISSYADEDGGQHHQLARGDRVEGGEQGRCLHDPGPREDQDPHQARHEGGQEGDLRQDGELT